MRQRGAWVIDETHCDKLPDGVRPEVGPLAKPQLAGQLPLLADDQPAGYAAIWAPTTSLGLR
jgi:hypothetical protein